MKRTGTSTVQTVAAVAIGVLIVGGVVWGVAGRTEAVDENPLNLPENLTTKALKEQAKGDRSQLFASMRESARSEELSDEQRRQAWRNMRRVMGDMMDERVNEYFDAPEEEKEAVLDRHIDGFAKMREGWEQRRKEREKERQARGEDEQSEQQRREAFRRAHRGGQTREQRKSRSEARNPDQTAQRMAYRTAMRQRAQARGIEMGGRGGRGGPHG